MIRVHHFGSIQHHGFIRDRTHGYLFFRPGSYGTSTRERKLNPYFEVEVVTLNGEPCKCMNGLRILPNGSIHDARETDLIVVSAILNIEKTLKYESEALDWLKEHYQRGAHIASICTGAFVLAETGLLDGKTATTHWGSADEFRHRYPQIDLKPERMVTDEGDLFLLGRNERRHRSCALPG